MKYYEKLRIFFKSKGLKQTEVSEKLEVSAPMLSRYLKGSDNFTPDFIIKLVKEFPEINLQYIFSENEELNHSLVQEPTTSNGMDNEEIVKELELIENKISKIRAELARKSPEE